MALAALAPAAGSADPSASAAGTITVDSTADEFDLDPTDGVCLTVSGTCTLRAAVTESNERTGVQEIVFDLAALGPDPTISQTNGAIVVNARVTIRGCPQGVQGPCVGARAGSGGSGLDLRAPGVKIFGLALSNYTTAIVAGADADELQVRGSWLGLRLDETPDQNAIGLELRGDDARIGGTVPAHRNVFAASSTAGLRVIGGDRTEIVGNYVGTLADGRTQAPSTGEGIVIRRDVDAADPALDNEIGDTVTEPASSSPLCDGGCNVISPNSASINLGFFSAESPLRTKIRGNFIGLDRGGGPLPTGTVLVGTARRTTVGGSKPGDRNFLVTANNDDAVNSVAGGILRNNFVGLNSRGTAALGGGGLQISGDSANPSVVRANRIAGVSFGIRARGNDGVIAGNVLGVKTNGLSAGFDQEAVEVSGSDYTIGGSSAPLRNVISGAAFSAQLRISGFGDPGNGDRNLVIGNYIGTDASGADLGGFAHGVEITNGAEDNLIGGNSLASENVISHNLAAINVSTSGAATDGNTFRRNRGVGNSSPFIQLSGGTNDGIAPPSLDPPSPTAVSGLGARPNAVVRAFLTVDDSQSGIRRFLAQGTANGAGTFTVNFPEPLPAGACVAASQTDAGGNSSALFGPVSVGGGPCDTAGPTTSFDSGPTIGNPTTDTTPTFTFHASEPGSSFECRIDGDPFSKCRGAPGRHTPAEPLALGDHIIRVRATDPLGNTGALKGRNFRIVAP